MLDVRTATVSRALLQTRYMTPTCLPPSTNKSFLPRRPKGWSGVIYPHASSHLLLHVLHDLPRDQSQADQPGVSQITFLLFWKKMGAAHSFLWFLGTSLEPHNLPEVIGASPCMDISQLSPPLDAAHLVFLSHGSSRLPSPWLLAHPLLVISILHLSL